MAMQYLIVPMSSLTLFLLAYQPLSKWYGGVTYTWKMPLEFFWVTVIYYSMFFILKHNRYRILVSLLPIVFFYVFYDYYFTSFGNVFKICDLSEVPELIDVLPFWQTTLYVAILLHIFFIIAINLTFIWYRYLLPFFLILLMTIIVEVNPDWYLSDLFEPYAIEGVTPWSDKDTAHNGYFTALLYFQATLKKSQDIADEFYQNSAEYEATQKKLIEFIKAKQNARNIHVIIMESFFNPQLLKKVSFNNSVYAKEFVDLVGDKESSVISPVFGGKTSQAEFETLCGVPALHRYMAIEFNAFTGNGEAFCVPTILKNAGYRVIANNAYKPNTFNTLHAYKGIGFDELYFPKQFAPKRTTYINLVDDYKFMFDGDLFKQNLEFIKAHLEKKDHAPLFNYMLGTYGHMPFDMDNKRHPMILTAMVSNNKLDDEFQRVTNQVYYRTQALADHLKELIKLDPHSLIIVIGDHLPKLSGMKFYNDMAYRNHETDYIHKPFALYILDGQVVKKPDIHDYDLITLMYDYITDNQYCKNYSCQRKLEDLEYQYNMNMARALH